jgi:hypothetical protein
MDGWSSHFLSFWWWGCYWLDTARKSHRHGLRLKRANMPDDDWVAAGDNEEILKELEKRFEYGRPVVERA